MDFAKHHSGEMGAYIEQTIMHGQAFETVFAFNLAENPGLAEQYLLWLAEQEVADAN